MNKFIEMLKKQKAEKMGKVVNKSTPTINDEDLSLAELREKYPHVKSNSKAGFLKKLKS